MLNIAIISTMKWFQNMFILAAGVPLLIAGLTAVPVLFLGALCIVLCRRISNPFRTASTSSL